MNSDLLALRFKSPKVMQSKHHFPICFASFQLDRTLVPGSSWMFFNNCSLSGLFQIQMYFLLGHIKYSFIAVSYDLDI